jgi:hypothetical protein
MFASHGIIQSINRVNIVTDGLVLNLDAGNAASYPGSGTSWTDLSGNGNNGTLTNGPTYDSGNGGSIEFDGVDDFILGTDNVNLNFGTGNYTLCCWFKTNTSIRRTILARFDYDGTGIIEKGYYIDILSTGKIRAAFASSGSNLRIADSNTTVNTNTYFFVTVTRTDAGTINVYVNGIFEASNTITVGTPDFAEAQTAPFSIGRPADYQSPAFTNYFLGNIPAVQIYNRALSASEIEKNFNALKSRYGL